RSSAARREGLARAMSCEPREGGQAWTRHRTPDCGLVKMLSVIRRTRSAPQGATHRFAHHVTADRAAGFAADSPAHVGGNPPGDLVGDRSGDLTRDRLARSQALAAWTVGPEQRAQEGAEPTQESGKPAARRALGGPGGCVVVAGRRGRRRT